MKIIDQEFSPFISLQYTPVTVIIYKLHHSTMYLCSLEQYNELGFVMCCHFVCKCGCKNTTPSSYNVLSCVKLEVHKHRQSSRSLGLGPANSEYMYRENKKCTKISCITALMLTNIHVLIWSGFEVKSHFSSLNPWFWYSKEVPQKQVFNKMVYKVIL